VCNRKHIDSEEAAATQLTDQSTQPLVVLSSMTQQIEQVMQQSRVAEITLEAPGRKYPVHRSACKGLSWSNANIKLHVMYCPLTFRTISITLKRPATSGCGIWHCRLPCGSLIAFVRLCHPPSIRMIPMGYAREINVPSDFLLNFTEDCEERLAMLKERCSQILTTLSAFVEGDGRPTSAFDHSMLKQIIAAENAAFLRLAGVKVAPLHDMVLTCVRCVES
jgi:hypothetical protein